MGLLFGLDPLELLGLEPHDWTVMVATLNVAAGMRNERDTQLVDAVSAATAARTISNLSKAFRK